MGWFTSFLYSQLFVNLPIPTKDFSGQTIIVTGSNTGLGLEAARHLSRLNTTLLILAVRNTTKGEVAKRSILASTGRAESSIEVWELDIQSYDSIKAFCVRANALKRLDAVLENAGIMTKHFKMVAGHESTITTNVVGTFLLAMGILPKLMKSAADFGTQSRLSIVASDLHFLARFPEGEAEDIFATLNDDKTADMSMERYSVSKLLQVLAVRELASHIENARASDSPAVIINCMTPGACKSDFDRESTGIAKILGSFMSAIIARTTEAGSRTLVAGLAAVPESTGGYMADCKLAEPSPMVLSTEGKALQTKVWNQLVRQLEIIQPDVAHFMN